MPTMSMSASRAKADISGPQHRVSSRGMLGVFAAAFCLIASMYGGGFSTIPAYLDDVFGTQFVGPIHGRLLTACRLQASPAR